MAAPSVSASINLDGTPEGSKLDQDYKRDADHRHKYALGSVDVGQKIVPGQPISQRYDQAAHLRGRMLLIALH